MSKGKKEAKKGKTGKKHVLMTMTHLIIYSEHLL